MKPKIYLQLTGCLMILIMLSSSCKKDNLPGSTYSPAPVYPPPPPNLLIGNKEIFWTQPWDTTSTGYKLILNAQLLTQDQINRGVDVGIAVLTADDSPWVNLPTTYYDIYLTDTVQLSFTALPGKLQVNAKTSVVMTNYKSDVFILYK